MKNRRSSLFTVLLILVLSGSVIPIYSLPHNLAEVLTEQGQMVQDAYQKLHDARNFDEMNRLVEQWKKVLSFVNQHHLLHRCWEHITSTVPVEMGIDDINRGNTHHDLNIEGGRCAWLFEQLTACQLPAVTRQSRQEELAQARSMAFDELIKLGVKEDELKLLIIKAALPERQEEKLALANDPNSPAIVLKALSDDGDATIRLAIAHNFSTDIHSLKKLADDDLDPTIRQAAQENLLYARSLAMKDAGHDIIEHFLMTHPAKTLMMSMPQPLILQFDLAIEEHLTAVRSAWQTVPSVRTDEPGPQTLAEAVDMLVNALKLPAPPAFCTENAHTFYCSASTSLEPGADLTSGFAIRKGETTIYSWETPQK